MKDQDSKDVLDFFIGHEFYGEIIDIENQKTPDLKISDGILSYAIEVKSKFDSDEYMHERSSKLLESNIFEEVVPIVPKNRIDGILGEGCKQLKSKNNTDFSLLWLNIKTANSERDISITKQTILGIKCVWDVSNDYVVDCYYYKNSSFFRFRDILDGVFIENTKTGEVEFWINNFSVRYEKIKQSKLLKEIPFNDPLQIVERDRLYIVESDVDRNNEDDVIGYLMKRYTSNNIKPFDMKNISVTQKVG